MSIDNLDFLNLNSLRNYPVKEGLSRISTDGAFTVPNNFIVDFELSATLDITKRFYISKIVNKDSLITVEVSDDSDVLAGVFEVNASSHTKYKKYLFIPTDIYAKANGIILVDSLENIKLQPSGIFSFTLATAEFETRTIIPGLSSLSRIIFNNANGKSFTVTGDIVIEARTNVKFKYESGKIIIDAGNDIGLNVACGNELNCIKTINGITPDNTGNFTLDFSDCAVFTPIPALTGLVLQDTCCQPCIGCDDIQHLTNRLIDTENNLITIKNYYADLHKLFEDFKATSTYTCNCPPGS
jgi:hypothetical protein